MKRAVHEIRQRLSLRTPQTESLEILAAVTDAIALRKDAELGASLDAVKALCPRVEDFERGFPSLTFALATGVGKTRLMGAFITYLHREKGVRNFFVLAPNLTIYDKLKRDFDPGYDGYVFRGIGDFAQRRPVVITGENYASHVSVDRYTPAQRQQGLGFDEVRINIFNIGKLNAETRGGSAPRMKRMSEYLGQSYFEHLVAQPDLVLLMDESHRYRAERGMAVLNELNPVLGIELTATPFTESPKGAVPFRNIAYAYPLSSAIRDGYVKQPVALTRENFQAKNFTDDELERVKLEDAIRVHETVKVELDVYARESGAKRVKPFVLVVASNTEHAERLKQLLSGVGFFGGRYAGKVIRVDSGQRGEERDEVVQRLLKVEDADEPTEIVIHVNMLKEGWDVRNLYVIVPLRAANARQLVEQTVGRGLRLPFGELTKKDSLDRLTIVAHDRFEELIEESSKPDSLIRGGVMIGREIPVEGMKVLIAPPSFAVESPGSTAEAPAVPPAPTQGSLLLPPTVAAPVQPVDPKVAEVHRRTLTAIQHMTTRPTDFPTVESLTTPEGVAKLTKQVAVLMSGAQLMTPTAEAELKAVVTAAAKSFVRKVIGIPSVRVLPDGEVACGYDDFELDVSSVNYASVDEAMLLKYLQDQSKTERIALDDSGWQESTLERQILLRLVDANDVSWELHKDLLLKLARQMADRIRALHPDDATAMRVVRYHMAQLAKLILTQMRAHYWTRPEGYSTYVDGGFRFPEEARYSARESDGVRDVHTAVEDKHEIRALVFGGFRKCVYTAQKFDSDTERRFAVLLEDDPAVEKWMKPARGLFTIRYDSSRDYEPDFVVETVEEKLLIEVKRRDLLDENAVVAKAAAGRAWCVQATEYELANEGKAWRYVLLPDDFVKAGATVKHLAASAGDDGHGGKTSG